MGNIMNSKTYDILKPVALIWLPALATLYFAVASIWGIPGTTNVIGTLSAIDAFLGAVLGISTKGFSQNGDGAVLVDSKGLKGIQAPNLALEDVMAKKQLVLKVVPVPDDPSVPAPPVV